MTTLLERKPARPLGVLSEPTLVTPELATKTLQRIWGIRGKRAGIKIPVPACDRSEQELRQLANKGRRIGFLPEILFGEKGSEVLLRMFPQMGKHLPSVLEQVANEDHGTGLFDYEAAIEAPYLNTTEQQLLDGLAAKRRLGMNLIEYIAASQDSFLFTGQWLDTGFTSVRLPGATDKKGKIVHAYFDRTGLLIVRWGGLNPKDHDPRLGGRSVKIKPSS